MNSFGCHARRAATGVALLGLAPVALGEATNLTAQAPLPDATFSVVRVIGALALVLAIFFAGLWLFRNWQRFVARTGHAPKLSVLEVKSLGSRHSLYVVGYERQRLLLGSSPTGVTLIHQLPEAPEGSNPSFPTTGFAETLSQVIHRKT